MLSLLLKEVEMDGYGMTICSLIVNSCVIIHNKMHLLLLQ